MTLAESAVPTHRGSPITNGTHESIRICKRCGYEGAACKFQIRSRDGGLSYQWQNICAECLNARNKRYWRSTGLLLKELSYVGKGFRTDTVEDYLWTRRVWFSTSDKHLGRYVDEFTFRLNEGNVKRHSLQRLDSFIDAVSGKRITYEELTAE